MKQNLEFLAILVPLVVHLLHRIYVTLELAAMAIGGSSLGRLNLLQQAIEERVR